MSYRKSWSRTFETGDFKIRTYFGMNSPRVCTVHERCFVAHGRYPATQGECSLIDLLDIPYEMPGTKRTLLTASIKGLVQGGGYGTAIHAALRFYADGASILERDLNHGGDWAPNGFTLNRDVDAVSKLDVNLYQWASIFLPGVSVIMHDAEIIINGEYYTDIPPEQVSVRLAVTNSKTGALVKGAYVALMSGARVVADGHTDGGEVLFENIDEGSYTVKVLASGYYSFEQSIEVEPPSVWYVLKIVPIPTVPIPDWVWWAVGGVAALGAITVIPSIIKRKGEEKVIVVR